MSGFIKAATKAAKRAAALREPTPFDLKHEAARVNAVKMLGLPENNTAADRLRALQERGVFPKERDFHGSLSDIRQVDIGRASGGGHGGKAFYTSPGELGAEDASFNYANLFGPDVNAKAQDRLEILAGDTGKSYNRIGDALVTRDRTRLTPKRREVVIRELGLGDNLGTVYPVYVRRGNEANLVDPKRSKFIEGIHQHVDDDTVRESATAPLWDDAITAYKDITRELPDDLSEMAYEGARADEIWKRTRALNRGGDLDDDYLSRGGVASEILRRLGVDTLTHPTQFGSERLNIAGKHTLALRPELVRSQFAAFDPARLNEPDIMGRARPDFLAALGVGLGGGLAVNAKVRQLREKQPDKDK